MEKYETFALCLKDAHIWHTKTLVSLYLEKTKTKQELETTKNQKRLTNIEDNLVTAREEGVGGLRERGKRLKKNKLVDDRWSQGWGA